MNKGLLLGVGLLAGLAVITWMMLGNVKKPNSSVIEPTPQGEMKKEATPQGTTTQVKEIEVSGDEYKFMPATLSLNSGDKVKLTFKNTGNLPHDLLIDELSVATKTISGGKEEVVEFTATKTGDFKFYCSVGNHRKQGMEGSVMVK